MGDSIKADRNPSPNLQYSTDSNKARLFVQCSQYFLTFIMPIVFEVTINIIFIFGYFIRLLPHMKYLKFFHVFDSPSRKGRRVEAPLTSPNKDFLKSRTQVKIIGQLILVKILGS